jgi:hypothetical protein
MRLSAHRGSFSEPNRRLAPMAALNAFSVILVVLLALSILVAIALAYRSV